MKLGFKVFFWYRFLHLHVVFEDEETNEVLMNDSWQSSLRIKSAIQLPKHTYTYKCTAITFTTFIPCITHNIHLQYVTPNVGCKINIFVPNFARNFRNAICLTLKGHCSGWKCHVFMVMARSFLWKCLWNDFNSWKQCGLWSTYMNFPIPAAV